MSRPLISSSGVVDGDATVLAPAVRAAIAEVDPSQAVNNVMTLEGVAGAATERYRFRAVLVGAFGSLALLLAMVGVFGVLAYSVQQRTRELGVRIALGATPGNVLSLVLSGAGRVVASGTVFGLLSAAGLGQAISSFLFGVQALDPVTFVSVGASAHSDRCHRDRGAGNSRDTCRSGCGVSK